MNLKLSGTYPSSRVSSRHKTFSRVHLKSETNVSPRSSSNPTAIPGTQTTRLSTTQYQQQDYLIFKKMKNPFVSIRQAWRDYKVGRALREKTTTTPNSPDETEEQTQPTKISMCPEVSTKEQSKPEITPCREEQREYPKKTPQAKKRGWYGWHRSRNPNSEFQWRGEFLIDGESSWRGTWVLEVNDLGALEWERERYVKKTTRQWPFSSHEARTLGGGQDDLMVYLGRP